MVWQQEHRLSYEDFLEKYQFIIYLFILLFLFVSLRLFHLQVIRGNYYRTISEQQRTQIILERAPRGIIYSAGGEVIVGNKTSYVALFYPFTQEATPPKTTLDRLGRILKEKKVINSLVKGWRSGQVVRLAEDLTRQEMFSLLEQRLMIPGISVVKEARREYAYPEAVSHLVGYINEITRRELDSMSEEGYRSGDWMGRGGLEQFYDPKIRGTDGGWQIEVDAMGHQTRLVRHVRSTIGNSLYTTINLKLQEVAASALAKSPTGRGAVVGVDPRNGEVRILVSSPGFDPNLAVTGEFTQFLKRKDLPLFNRTMQALYPPGSTFKIVTMAAALAGNKASLSQVYNCQGSFKYGNKTFKCWEKKGHGRLNMTQAFAKSCNVYFYQLALKVGPELLEKYSRDFRLGEPTGLEGYSEKAGLVPSPEWKKEKLRDSWHPGDTINMGIGQGALWVTPAQMASLISTVANGGTVFKLHLVSKIVNQSNETVARFRPQRTGMVNLPGDVWANLHFALKEVVKNGTAGA
ncbi:MAG: penicillin-binding protein 2, partial [Elusimicrobia bacterium RIFOXYA1_FULL_47_7]